MLKNSLDILVQPGVTLSICPSGGYCELYEEPDAVDWGESYYQLVEGSTYEYEFVCQDKNEVYQFAEESEIVKFSRLKNRVSCGVLRTGIYVGNLELPVVRLGDANPIAKVNLEIRSVKSEYRTDYRKMLEDITSKYTDLVLQQGSPVTQHLEVDDNTDPITLYQRFAFVRSIVESEAFADAIHQVVVNPVHSWADTTVQRKIANVRRLGRSEMRQLASAGDRVPFEDSRRYGLPEEFTSLPRYVTVAHKCDTVDTPENQFVKYVLRTFSSFCSDISHKKKANDRLRAEANRTCDIIDGYLGTLFFRQISLPSHLNLNSPVLQRKEGYREVLQAWLIFDLAAKLSWKGGDNIYSAGKRNVAALYEYWVFFQLLDAVGRVFSIDPASKDELVTTDSDKIDLNLRQGRMTLIEGQNVRSGRTLNVRYYYNRTFTHTQSTQGAPFKPGTWTVNMRPDYTLTIWPGEITMKEAEEQELIVHIHFDAKYRLEHFEICDQPTDSDGETDVSEEISQELTKEKEAEEGGEYKRADLLKMHAYKDAIRRTSGAYVIYPGTENRQMRGFHEIIPGLGAFCLSPKKQDDQVDELRAFISEVAQHMVNRVSQRQKISYYQYKTYNEPLNVVEEVMPEPAGENRHFLPDETWVLVGYYKDQEHLDWILKNGLYNTRTGTGSGSLKLNEQTLGAKYLLLHRESDTLELIKIADGGPKLYSRADLIKKGYPVKELRKTKGAKARKNLMYIVFSLDKSATEEELIGRTWSVSKLTQITGRKAGQLARPFVVRLTDLMK